MSKKTQTKIVSSLFSAILIIGGFFIFNIPKSSAASDDPTWTTSSHTLPAAIDCATSVQSGNKIYVMGGKINNEDNNTVVLDAVYIGTIASDGDVTWTTSSHTLPKAIYGAAGVVSGNKIYFMGGGTQSDGFTDAVYIGTIGSDGDVTWTTSTHTLPIATGYTTGVVSNNKIYLMGGEICGNNICNTLDTVYVGTIGSNGDVAWTTSSHTLPAAIDDATSVQSGNKIYVMGGYNNNYGLLDAVCIGIIGSDGDVTWTTSSNKLPQALDATTSVQSGNKIYAMGGETVDSDNNWSVIDTVYIGTIGNDGDVTWTTSSNKLPTPSGYATSAVFGNRIYVVSGVNDDDNWIHTDAVYIGALPQDSTTSSSKDQKNQKASISSWKAYQYTDQSKCAARLRVSIRGMHFKNDALVKINGTEASQVDVKNSRNITANFCLAKLLDNQASRKRDLTVTNPKANTETADKQINLNHINYNLTSADFDPTTTQGITNIQKALSQLGLLDQQYVTGIYGPLTIAAVKTFQGNNGLPQTGTVGPLTKAKLGEKG